MTDRKLKMSGVFIFEIKDAKMDKTLNFLKGHFSITSGPMDMIFGVFLETYVRLLKNLTSEFYSRYSKSYSNLSAKVA